MFVENGKPQQLIEELEAAEGKVRIPFQADQIPSGEGNTTTIVTMEPSHPFVSIIVRIVPSPDWFVGVSSLNLCENSTWRTRKLLDLYPWDAGTDSGFTFSSPNFETEPQEAVSQITATTPSHPANSFYYPRIKKLPRLGFLEFNLLAVEANHATLNAIESPPINNEQILEECILDGDATNRKNDTETRKQKGLNTEEEFDSSESFTLKEHCGKSQTSTPLDCEVSQWVSWGLCSHFCGNGIRQRTRYITLQPANGGDPCPTLMEKESCEETPCSTDSPATSERLSTTTVILTDSPATSKRPSITPAPSTDSPATSDRPSMTPARSTDSPATSDRPSMTPARSTDSPATSNMPSTTPVHSTDSSATSNRLSMTLADSTDSPATSDKPSTTPAPNKKIFNLKWVPSQESHGALWRRIYHRLLSRTKGLLRF
ncbi:hypothetical protein NDU88_007473 [Pleurodeles waltl]|uniref:Spondin domain-containing protein n=1 Tax=Pleurodeles waltl TaxID=8319 RepID=A0AAV7QRT6_PLEWA|nr:hypothetical protein NDU88_007473 [Pleurodeles waltl]